MKKYNFEYIIIMALFPKIDDNLRTYIYLIFKDNVSDREIDINLNGEETKIKKNKGATTIFFKDYTYEIYLIKNHFKININDIVVTGIYSENSFFVTSVWNKNLKKIMHLNKKINNKLLFKLVYSELEHNMNKDIFEILCY